MCKNFWFFLSLQVRQKEENVGHFYLFYIWEIESSMILWHFESVAVSFEFSPAWLSSVGIEWPMTAQEEKKEIHYYHVSKCGDLAETVRFFLQN